MPSDIILLALTVICSIGLIQIIKQLLTSTSELLAVRRFYKAFHQYYESDGTDEKTYTWLMERSQPIQWTLGEGGILSIYKPPFATGVLQNIPVIINFIPELRQAFNGGYSHAYNHDIAIIVDDTLLRFMGVLKFRRNHAIGLLLNPLQWLIKGIQAILGFPILLLQWTGVISTHSAGRLQEHMLFKLVTLLLTVIGVVGSIIGIIVDWERFTQLTNQILHLVP
jgi:hypothetical protein